MSQELFFIYDTHCPWSYAATSLVNEISEALPQINITLLHCSYFDGEQKISQLQIDAIKRQSNAKFGKQYLAQLEQTKDSTLTANLLTWAQQKAPKTALPLLNALQYLHFQQGSELITAQDIEATLTSLKLSAPAKTLTCEKLTKATEENIHQIFELQDIIGTKAIPALLLAVNDNLTLLSHNLYLENPKEIINAINIELKKA